MALFLLPKNLDPQESIGKVLKFLFLGIIMFVFTYY